MNSMNKDIEIEAHQILEEYETGLLGGYSQKDVLAMLRPQLTARDKWKAQVEPMQQEIKKAQCRLSKAKNERDQARIAMNKAESELDEALIMKDRDYTIVGQHVWLLINKRRWRADSIVRYTVNLERRIETINSEKLGTYPDGMHERHFLDILEMAVPSDPKSTVEIASKQAGNKSLTTLDYSSKDTIS
jgi:hypothetical protein